jgi:hypothetical protein
MTRYQFPGLLVSWARSTISGCCTLSTRFETLGFCLDLARYFMVGYLSQFDALFLPGLLVRFG